MVVLSDSRKRNLTHRACTAPEFIRRLVSRECRFTSGLFFHPLLGVNLSRAAAAGGVRGSVLLQADVCLMTEVPFRPACVLHLTLSRPSCAPGGDTELVHTRGRDTQSPAREQSFSSTYTDVSIPFLSPQF